MRSVGSKFHQMRLDPLSKWWATWVLDRTEDSRTHRLVVTLMSTSTWIKATAISAMVPPNCKKTRHMPPRSPKAKLTRQVSRITSNMCKVPSSIWVPEHRQPQYKQLDHLRRVSMTDLCRPRQPRMQHGLRHLCKVSDRHFIKRRRHWLAKTWMTTMHQTIYKVSKRNPKTMIWSSLQQVNHQIIQTKSQIRMILSSWTPNRRTHLWFEKDDRSNSSIKFVQNEKYN